MKHLVTTGCRALRGLWGVVVLALWACCPAASWAASPPPDQTSLTLDRPAVALYPAGPSAFVTLGADNTLTLRDLKTGQELDSLMLPGTPVDAAQAAFSNTSREMAFVVKTTDAAAPYALVFVLTNGRTLENRRLVQGTTAREELQFSAAASPALEYIFGNPNSKRPTADVLVWDRADPSIWSIYALYGGQDVQRTFPTPPAELLGIKTPKMLLAIDGLASEVSFFDPYRGRFTGNVYDPALGLNARARTRRAGGSRLRSFVPRAETGGTGQVAVINLDQRELSVLGTVASSRSLRMARPINAALPKGMRDLSRVEDLLVVGTPTLDRIYVAERTAGRRTRIWGYDRLKGGLEPLESFTVPFGLRDLKRFEFGKTDRSGGVYAVLRGDGLRVDLLRFLDTGSFDSDGSDDLNNVLLPIIELVEADIAQAAGQPIRQTAENPLVTEQPVIVAPNIVEESIVEVAPFLPDVLTTQRWLATLGYSVGTLDGLEGPQTRSAVRAFQLDSGLPVTGQVDQTTASLLSGRLASASLGRWHALIASYSVNAEGCRFARADVAQFAKLLKGAVDPGTQVYVARTSAPEFYVVAISTGEDRAKAVEVSKAIRRVSGRSADKKTGADSYVKANLGWAEDPSCRAREEISGP